MSDLHADLDAILRPALEQSSISVVLVDETNRILFFNQAAEHLWGYRRDEVLGQDMQLLLPPDLHVTHDDYVRKNRAGGENRLDGSTREVLMEHRDGRQLWASLSLSKVDLGGRIHYMAFARDVSAEVATREQNRLLLMAVDHTDKVVFVLDEERRIVQTNRAFTKLFGYTKSEAIGKVPSQFLASPRADETALARLRSSAWGATPFHEEILAVDKHGRDVWLQVSVNPVFDEANGHRVRNLVVALSDITEDRRIRDLERDMLAALTSNLSFMELGEYLCRRIELITPGVVATLTRVADGRIHHWAAPHFSSVYTTALDGMRIGEGVASCGTAAHRGEPVMVYDIDTDPLWASYKHFVLPLGLHACWSYPVKRRNGSVAATFAFYFREGGTPDVYLERIAHASVHLCALAIEREENRQRLTQLVQFDTLTGLPNRNQLHHLIDERLTSSAAQGIFFFCIDVDRFKDINDTLGHAAGDRALVAIANRIQKHLVPGQILCRAEGDLFVIVAPGGDVNGASLMAERLQNTISAPIEVDGHQLSLSASVGISHYPGDDDGRDILLAKAKQAMYQAKKSGGGGYRFFDSEMNLMAHDRLLIGAALKRAIAHRELYMCYQPQVRSDTGELYGVEALVRWHDAEFGEISPEKLIGLAEEIGEIEPIGLWALHEVCRQRAAWRDAGVPVPLVSVNLSPLSFRNRDLPTYIAGLLRDHDMPGTSLTIEITESAAMTLTRDMLEIVHKIRALGVGLSMDDFGTGFSNLSNLANLPVTEIKIDRSFIAQCLQESRLQSLVMAVIDIGKSLGLTVVAEGVETEAQWDLLKKHHCPVVQGYFFSRPLAPRDIPAWIDHRNKSLAPGPIA